MLVPGDSYDVIVIGGGPSGAATAGILAMRGHKVLILEREKFPRYHIGESLITGALYTIEELGLTDRLEALGFTKKYGGTFQWRPSNATQPATTSKGAGADPLLWGFRFDDTAKFPYAYHVRRAEFDSLLLTRARELGAHVLEDATVQNLIWEDERAVGLTYLRKSERVEHEVRSRMVIDASGQSHIVARHLDLIDWHSDLKNIAVWSYFQNCDRYEGERAGDILTERCADGWFWFIPLSDGTVSIGYVTSIDAYQESGMSVEELYEARFGTTIEVKRLTEGALRVAGFRTIRDWSYTCQRFWGPGWVLVGDAAAFIDPLLSTGLTLALRAAQGAAHAVDAALRVPEIEDEVLARYEKNYRDFLDCIVEFVRFFYDRSEAKEVFWDKAQEVIDPQKEMEGKVDFAILLSGLHGERPIFDDITSVAPR